MSSEEEDYMSDVFLTKSVTEIRPGLVHGRAKQREYKIEAKRVRYNENTRLTNKPTKLLEQERREEGLSNAITTTNKGFAMLTKMGYKPGEAIGKSAQGIVEPIGIQIKLDRGGLGREAALKRLKERRAEIRMKRLTGNQSGLATISTEEFRKRVIQKAEEKQIEINFGKCQGACERLDLKENVASPAMIWFWPRRETEQSSSEDEKDDEEEDDDKNDVDYEPAEKLEMITDYLRTTYCYCHWCGTHYDDSKDMTDNCPGPNKDDH